MTNENVSTLSSLPELDAAGSFLVARVRIAVLAAVAPGVLAAAGCASSMPKHTGYPAESKAPWETAEKVRLGDDWTARVDGKVSYPKRRRAQWYVMNLPADGKLSVKLTFVPWTKDADLGVEILDHGFNVRAPGEPGEDEDDAGRTKKLREVEDIRAGKVYVHVYTLGKPDRADFKLRIEYEPGDVADPRATFPHSVPNPPLLAAVPASDDAPRARRGPRPAPPPPEPEPEGAAAALFGSIIEFGEGGGGTRIIINKGSSHGVQKGWEGYVINRATKKPLPGSTFRVSSVSNDESEAVVRLGLNSIESNRRVIMKPAAAVATP